MATFPKSTGQGLPPDGSPGPFPSFGNDSALYMATLSLPRLTICLLVWFFSSSVVLGIMIPVPLSPLFKSRNIDSKVELAPSSPVSSPSSPPLLGESFTSSNQETKKKKNTKKKKKSDKHEATCAAIAPSTSQVGTPPTPQWKVKFPCKLCKDDHLLHECPAILRILEVWSPDLAHPSLSSKAHADATLSTGNDKKKGNV